MNWKMMKECINGLSGPKVVNLSGKFKDQGHS